MPPIYDGCGQAFGFQFDPLKIPAAIPKQKAPAAIRTLEGLGARRPIVGN
jgi:hypothetical protein